MTARFESSIVGRAVLAAVLATGGLAACADDGASGASKGATAECAPYPGPFLAVECDGGATPGPGTPAFVHDAATHAGCVVFPNLSDAAYATEACVCVAAAEAGCQIGPGDPMPYQWDCLPSCRGVPFSR